MTIQEEKDARQKKGVFKKDVTFAAQAMLVKHLDTISSQLADGFGHEKIIDAIMRKEKELPPFDLIKINEIYTQSGVGDDLPIVLSGRMVNGGMVLSDLLESLMANAVTIAKDAVRKLLLDVTVGINESNHEYIEVVLRDRMKRKFPFEAYRAREEESKRNMLFTWLNTADEVMKARVEVYVGNSLDEFSDAPLSHFAYSGVERAFIIVDRDLATFFPEFKGYTFEQVAAAYEMAKNYNNIEDAPLSTRMVAASKGYGLKVLVDDEDPAVRIEVAKHGYGLDLLNGDDDEDVRREVQNYLRRHGMTIMEWSDANRDKWASHKELREALGNKLYQL